jgi:hypothetical protein
MRRMVVQCMCFTAVMTAASLLAACGSPGDPELISSPSAEGMVQSVVVPRDATFAASPPSSSLSKPAQKPLCNPLIDVVRFWSVPENYSSLEQFLERHPPHGMTFGGQGSWNGPDQVGVDIVDFQKGSGFDGGRGGTLVLSAVQLSANSSGLRADAEIVPPHAQCINPGGDLAGGVSR